MVELHGIFCVRRLEKGKRTKFYWGVAKVCVDSIQNVFIETFCVGIFLSDFFEQKI